MPTNVIPDWWTHDEARIVRAVYCRLVFYDIVYPDSLQLMYESLSWTRYVYIFRTDERAEKFLRFLRTTTTDGEHGQRHRIDTRSIEEIVVSYFFASPGSRRIVRLAKPHLSAGQCYKAEYLNNLADMIEDKLGRKVPRVTGGSE